MYGEIPDRMNNEALSAVLRKSSASSIKKLQPVCDWRAMHYEIQSKTPIFFQQMDLLT